MISSVNLQEVKEKLYSKLSGSGWDSKLRSYLLGTEMDTVLEILLSEAQDGKRFTPPVKYFFNALEKCPFENTRVVFIGQDPYPQINTADGIAFSCSIKDKPEVSLKYIMDAIDKTVPPEFIDVRTNDLSRWADQGILMLNTALTTTIGKPGTHQLLWRSFMVTLLDALIWNKPGLIYVFLGKKAQEYMDLIPDNNYKIAVNHPASAAYTGQVWDCEDMFNRVNAYLEIQEQPKIIW